MKDPGKTNRLYSRKSLVIPSLFIFSLAIVFQFLPKVVRAGLSFSFHLDSQYTTSAGVYAPNGTLVKTLWSGRILNAGTHIVPWDGTNDLGQGLPNAKYQIRVLYHNVQYVWDGVVGNTSENFSSVTDNIHRSFNDVAGLASAGDSIYYCVGYNELETGLRKFATADPQSAPAVAAPDFQTNFNYIASDGAKYFIAAAGDTNYASNSDFVVAYAAGTDVPTPFASGTNWTAPVSKVTYSGVIDVGTSIKNDGGVHAATGIAVQQQGTILAVAHGPEDVIRLYNKVSGTSLGTISVNDPQELAFDTSGNLWVIAGDIVVEYTGVGAANSKSVVLAGLVQPLGIAANKSTVLVADGGSSEQLKAYSLSGDPQWTLGLAGGYAANGPLVEPYKFQFNTILNVPNVPITFLDDGSFWVGDAANHRLLHFDTNRNYVEQVAYIPASYSSAVDVNNPTRVFSGFLEYAVDYSVPLEPGDPSAPGGDGCWKLVNNWGQDLPAKYYNRGESWAGLLYVATLSNGRTYAIASTTGEELVELTGSGIRDTGIGLTNSESLYEDGSIRYNVVASGIQTVYTRQLVGFDSNENPIWSDPSALASSLANRTTAVASPGQWTGRLAARFPITSSGIVVSYNTSDKYNPSTVGTDVGMHLGGVTTGGSSWTWMASPTVTKDVPLVPDGRFDIGDSVTYAGNEVMASGQNIICGYHGEFWDQSEANQFMHWWDDGLFVGQFGVPGNANPDPVAPGKAGNAFSPSLVSVNGDLYLYHNDESQHGGVHRWHILNTDSISELTGSGVMGTTVVLSEAAPSSHPVLREKSGNRSVELSWTGNASDKYDIQISQRSGGPYSLVARGIKDRSYSVTGLKNGHPYYFVITPAESGSKLKRSSEVKSFPYDDLSAVQTCGTMTEGNIGHLVDSSELSESLPALTDLDQLRGDLARYKIGSEGYEIFDFGGPGKQIANLHPPLSVVVDTGWSDMNFISDSFTVDGVRQVGAPYASSLWSDPTGSVTIIPGDKSWHYLTVFSPAKLADKRQCSISLASSIGDEPSVRYNIDEIGLKHLGRNHVFQFLFHGNVVLKVTSPTGQGGTLQALFFDRME